MYQKHVKSVFNLLTNFDRLKSVSNSCLGSVPQSVKEVKKCVMGTNLLIEWELCPATTSILAGTIVKELSEECCDINKLHHFKKDE